MKKLTASEARDLTELAGMNDIYKAISEEAQEGRNKVDFTELSEREFNQLIADGFNIYTDYGMSQLMKFDKETMDNLEFVTVSWEV